MIHNYPFNLIEEISESVRKKKDKELPQSKEGFGDFVAIDAILPPSRDRQIIPQKDFVENLESKLCSILEGLTTAVDDIKPIQPIGRNNPRTKPATTNAENRSKQDDYGSSRKTGCGNPEDKTTGDEKLDKQLELVIDEIK